jgi:hypothetical protein
MEQRDAGERRGEQQEVDRDAAISGPGTRAAAAGSGTPPAPEECGQRARPEAGTAVWTARHGTRSPRESPGPAERPAGRPGVRCRPALLGDADCNRAPARPSREGAAGVLRRPANAAPAGPAAAGAPARSLLVQPQTQALRGGCARRPVGRRGRPRGRPQRRTMALTRPINRLELATVQQSLVDGGDRGGCSRCPSGSSTRWASRSPTSIATSAIASPTRRSPSGSASATTRWSAAR